MMELMLHIIRASRSRLRQRNMDERLLEAVLLLLLINSTEHESRFHDRENCILNRVALKEMFSKMLLKSCKIQFSTKSQVGLITHYNIYVALSKGMSINSWLERTRLIPEKLGLTWKTWFVFQERKKVWRETRKVSRCWRFFVSILNWFTSILWREGSTLKMLINILTIHLKSVLSVPLPLIKVMVGLR